MFSCMTTSSNGNIFRVTGPLCGEFTGHRWIPRTKASDAELWCFFDLRLNKRLSKQSLGWWFDTPSHPLWRHCNRHVCHAGLQYDHPSCRSYVFSVFKNIKFYFPLMGSIQRITLHLLVVIRDITRTTNWSFSCFPTIVGNTVTCLASHIIL